MGLREEQRASVEQVIGRLRHRAAELHSEANEVVLNYEGAQGACDSADAMDAEAKVLSAEADSISAALSTLDEQAQRIAGQEAQFDSHRLALAAEQKQRITAEFERDAARQRVADLESVNRDFEARERELQGCDNCGKDVPAPHVLLSACDECMAEIEAAQSQYEEKR